MIKSFRLVSFLEGVSYLAILFVTMPLKYLYDNPQPNKSVGMIHGVLFIAYILLAILIKKKKKWTTKNLAIVLFCSIIPFGTFWMDRKYFAEHKETTTS